MSYDFAVRIKPVADPPHPNIQAIEHEWAYFQGGTLQQGSAGVNTVPLADFPAALVSLFTGTLAPQSPWTAHKSPTTNITTTLLNHCEHIFAQCVEPSKRVHVDAGSWDTLSQILQHYGEWLLEKVILGDDQQAKSVFTQAKRAQVRGDGAKFRLLLCIDGEKPARDLLSSLTYELMYQRGYFLRSSRRVFYRVPPMPQSPDLPNWADRVESFLEKPKGQLIKKPRVYIGIAGPDDSPGRASLPLLDFRDSLGHLVPRLDLANAAGNPFDLVGGLQMRFSDADVNNENISPHDLVVIMAHGKWDNGWTVCLNQSQDNFQKCDVTGDALGDFLTHCRSRLAIIFCCQQRDLQNGTAHPDLGEQLLEQDSGLSAVVTFRSELPVETARRFLDCLVEIMRTSSAFELAPLLAKARYATTNGIADATRLEWAIPAFNVREELAWNTPPQDPWVSLLSGTQTPNFNKNRPNLDQILQDLCSKQQTVFQNHQWGNTNFDQELQAVFPPGNPIPQHIQWGVGVRYGPPLPKNEIAAFPVTVEDYYQTLDQTVPGTINWDLPMTGLKVSEIQAYLNAKTKADKDNWIYRLPTWFEWIIAAYGPQNEATFFPWGNQWDDQAANLSGKMISVYDTKPTQPDIYGMLGNCWELICNGQNRYLLMGGDCHSKPWQCTPCYLAPLSQSLVDALAPANNCRIGFRVVRSK